MIVYAESSAFLAWLLGEPDGERVGELLAAAEFVVSSELTLVECDRVLHRALSLGSFSIEELEECQRILRRVSSQWILLELGATILQRARSPFPHEPVRSLDALHLASALEAKARLPETVLLTFDRRVGSNGRALGFEVLPGEEVVH